MMRDTIANIISDDVDAHLNSGIPWDATKAADAIIDALSDMIPDLVWKRGQANSPTGHYILATMDNEPEEAEAWFVYRNGKPLGLLGMFYSEETARIAVEAYHKAQAMAMFGLGERT